MDFSEYVHFAMKEEKVNQENKDLFLCITRPVGGRCA